MANQFDCWGTLAENAREFRKALQEVDTGPLQLAPKVLVLAAAWDLHLEEAGGLSVNGWIRRELGAGKTLAFFRRRAAAVEKLGESVRRTIHHEGAVRIAGTVPPDKWGVCVFALQRERIKNGHNALSPAQAMPIVWEIVGKSPAPKHCRRCSVLEAEIAELKAKHEPARENSAGNE